MTKLTLLALVFILLSACGGDSTASDTPTIGGTQTTSDADSGATSAPTPTTTVASAASILPERCAEGLAEYLVEIEPLLTGLDPSNVLVGEFWRFDDAVGDKSIELLQANDSRAPYSCSEVGLEWAYFDTGTPWDAVLEVAAARAPGTLAYLETLKRFSDIELDVELSDLGIATCEDTVARIKQAVAEQQAAGVQTAAHMPLDAGIEFLGLYLAYTRQVGAGECPRDQLGNAEYGFRYDRLLN